MSERFARMPCRSTTAAAGSGSARSRAARGAPSGCEVDSGWLGVGAGRAEGPCWARMGFVRSSLPMGLFDRFRKKAPAYAAAPADSSIDAIFDRVRKGDSQGALEAVATKLQATAARVGVDDPAYAAVLYEHGSLCLALGMTKRALQSMRAATRITGPAPDDEKNRLTYLMNLSDILAHDGALEEAMRIAKDGLAARERFYGREHPGYAYGLETVAEVALAQARYQEALEHAQPALAIYDAHQHSRVPHAWALLFLAGAGTKGTWKDLQIAPQMASAVLREISSRMVPVAPEVERGAVETLAPLAGEGEVVVEAWKRLSRVARKAGDQATRLAAIGRLRDYADAMGDQTLAIEAELALALAYDQQGADAEATRAYEEAERRARAAGSADWLCQALRNAGLFFLKQSPERGLALLREAAAVPGASAEEHARSQIALGIRLQHGHDLAGARALLVSALAALDPVHPDAECAQSHLRAIDERGSCECDGVSREVHAQLERVVRERLPEGLLESIALTDGKVSIHVTRAMTDAEARLVADTVDLAMAEMGKRHSRVYGN
jgi:tetratricopeptide (TPR) repeat protein